MRKPGWAVLRARGANLLLGAALAAVGLAYGLGYRLNWAEEEGRPAEDEAEVAAVPAPAAQEAEAKKAAIAPPALIAPKRDPEMRPESREAAWDEMIARLGKLAARYPGRVGIVLQDLRNGRSWTYHPDDLFPSASLIKVPILIAAFARVREGGLSLDEELVLSRLNRVGGSGSLKWRPNGTRLPVRELLGYMITESDNTATRMVLDRLGLDYVQKQFPGMGLLYTGIYKEGMSIRGGRVARENYTTAREMTMLLEKIYRGEAVDKDSSQAMLEILKRPKAVASRLAKGLPAGWEIAHKTGLLRQACHDSAIFFAPSGDYAMTVLTGQNRSYRQAKDFITRLAHVTFRAYAGPRYYAQLPRHRRRR